MKNTDKKHSIIKKMNSMKWYHKIDLGGGIITPGYDWEKMWDSTTSVLDTIDYKDKRVLDLGTWDGYWAFDAEKRGASSVVASDSRIKAYENLLFARSVLDSKVLPLFNVPVQDLENRLKTVGLDQEFDIVHHLGLLYHLRDPMISLAQVRKVISKDGLLVLETAFVDDDENSFMAFAGTEDKYHFYGASDTWAPSKLCLREILKRSGFKPIQEDNWSISQRSHFTFCGKKTPLARITMIATPIPFEECTTVDQHKILGTQ